MRLSVIVPTRDRPERLRKTLEGLLRQDLPSSDYEVLVVDDGSSPPLSVAAPVTVVRLAGLERSAARNAGAREARGDILVFLDDDIDVGADFLSAHWAAHEEWPGVLAVGRIDLPAAGSVSAFVGFRQALEREALPRNRGLVTQPNCCTAGNMSLPRHTFHALGGFAEDVSSGEDQDLALRHSQAGGRIAFLPEAVGLHRDEALDLASYCRRAEWGNEHIIAFCRRHPDWPDNQARDRVNGPARWGREPLGHSLRKAAKSVLAWPPSTYALLAVARLLERVAPGSAALEQVFRAALGVHLFRGYRRGLKRAAAHGSGSCRPWRGRF